MSRSFDACIIVDILRGRRPDFRERLRLLLADKAPLYLCPLAFHELMLGANINARPDFQRQRVLEVCDFFKIEDWTAEDASAAAQLRADLRARGLTIGGFDALIAGQALARGWTLVTSNVREFGRIEGLTVEGWI